MSGRFEGISDEAWLLLGSMMPGYGERRGRGMPPAPFRAVINSILYVLITGCRWCDIPDDRDVFASKTSSHRWLMRWQDDGTFDKLCKGIISLADVSGKIDWSYSSVDGSFSLWQRRGRIS